MEEPADAFSKQWAFLTADQNIKNGLYEESPAAVFPNVETFCQPIKTHKKYPV